MHSTFKPYKMLFLSGLREFYSNFPLSSGYVKSKHFFRKTAEERRGVFSNIDCSEMYSDRVQEVLEYLSDHPINVESERMFYQPTVELDSSRLPNVIEGLTAEDVMLEQAKNSSINSKPVDKMQEHSADVTVAMLYMACQGMDEAHNIVLPYSWPQESHMGLDF